MKTFYADKSLKSESVVVNDILTVTEYASSGLLKAIKTFDTCFNLMHSFNDNPSYVTFHEDGDRFVQKWHYYGRLHREDGPAHISERDKFRNAEEYYSYGVLHRVDGPAQINVNQTTKKNYVLYYIFGEQKNGNDLLKMIRTYKFRELKK